MKFNVLFKTPDVLYVDIYETEEFKELDDEEQQEVREFIEKYVKYGELLKVEFDIKRKTVIVLEN